MNTKHAICVLVVILYARVKSERVLDVISEPDGINIKSESLKDNDHKIAKLNGKDLRLDGPLVENFNDTITDASTSNIWSEITSFFKTQLEESLKIDKESPDVQKFTNKTIIFAKAFQVKDKILPLTDKNNNDLPIFVLENTTKTENYKKVATEDILSAIKNVQEKEFQRIAGKQEQNTENQSINIDTKEDPFKISTSSKVESILDNLENVHTETKLGVLDIIPRESGNNNNNSIKIANNENNLNTLYKNIIDSNVSIQPTILSTLETTFSDINLPKSDDSLNQIEDHNTKLVKNIVSPDNLPKTDDYLEKNIAENPENNIQDNEIYHFEFPLNIDYGIHDDNSTDYPIIDYVNFYAEYTNEYVDYTEEPVTDSKQYESVEIGSNGTEIDNLKETTLVEDGKLDNLTSTISSWIASIFIKLNDSNQFMYYCDGAVLTDTVILTAARCVNISNTIEVDDFLVILGKKSLQFSVEGETVHKVKQIKRHEKFTTTNVIKNDLAVLYLENPANFSDLIQPAVFDCGERKEDDENDVSTAWAISGELKIVVFEKNAQSNCPLEEDFKNKICATFGDEVPLCPSYGGLYLMNPSLNNQTDPIQHPWCLRGIRSADPTNRGVCFDKTVTYTNLSDYKEWISGAIGK